MRTEVGWLLIALWALDIFAGAKGAVNIPSKAVDFPQCHGDSSSCPNNSRCEEATSRGYYCICNSGFYNQVKDTHVSYPNGSCTDIDECTKFKNVCTRPAFCVNTIGSFLCNCPTGYVKQDINQSGRDVICEDAAKCRKTSECPPHSSCLGNTCVCEPGFRNRIGGTDTKRDGNCTDINECLLKPCAHPAVCNNMPGNYSCDCPEGYTKYFIIRGRRNLTSCAEIEGFFSTSQPTTVINFTTPSATNPTTCPAGYVMNFTGGVMECSEIEGFFSTSQPTTVINFTTPSATNPTTCPAGYVMKFTGGVMECSDINECIEQPSACGNYSTCNNMIGSFMCNCQAGFRDIFPSGSAQISCTDVDECMEHPSPCGNNSLCKNTAGSFICSCKAGYKEVFQIGSSQLQCVAVKDLCGTYLQEQNKTLSNCYAKDPLCILQQSTYHLLESSCQDNRTKLDIKNITNSASEILSKPSWSALNSSEVSTAVNGLLETVETSVLKSFSKHPTNRNFSTPEIAVATKVVQENCSFLTLNVGLNSMNVSCELLPNPEDGAVFISYRDLNSILSGSLLLELEDLEKNNAAVVVNSQVVTGSITSRKKEKLNPPVTFYLNNLQAPDSSKTFLCVYWDLDLIGWSQRGCNITFSNVSHTLCSCDHLSSFAVIIAPCDIKEDRGLLVVSRIGLSVSLLCLSLSLLTFLLCRSLRSAHTSMLTALSGCLFLGQLIILFGLHQTQFPILCSIIAGCLHYILLCAFCWMTLESVLLFLTVRNLNAMNYLTSRRSHFPTACLIGFGVPAVIVTISAAVRSDGYGTKKSCWLNLNLIWSFLGPVSVFITINTILLILTLWLLRAKLASLNKNVSSLKNTRLLTFKALAQLFILGCTWVLGFFQCGTGAIVASYLFTICNSLQGAFIFLVHCLLNHQVREEYRKVFHRLHIKKPESETVSGSTLPMTLKSATISEVVKSDTVIDHHSELSKTELSKTEWCKTSDDTNH
ncbi:adhesion G protein-coupled receptor E4 isoform X3 [Xenopus laevis]|uniref:Adhesion G protein-coupled receptor E4 isoform X3 n=1 Tax=Xenopus laevis TaxID=8355 RepID=A0A8J0ULC2_XENLA|nr:adhesion G protein-coupled receptor E4 isoform X3 [Xenopus laevis]